MNSKIIRLMGLFGVLAPFIGCLMILLSVWMNPIWSFYDLPFSSLGAGGLSAQFFNSGLLMMGSLMMLFGSGLFELTKGNFRGQLGSALFLLTSILLVVLGVVTINIQPYHNLLAYGFFAVIPLSMIAFTIFHYNNGRVRFALLAGGAALIGSLIWFLGSTMIALNQLLVVGSLSLWEMVLGYWMYNLEVEDSL